MMYAIPLTDTKLWGNTYRQAVIMLPVQTAMIILWSCDSLKRFARNVF